MNQILTESFTFYLPTVPFQAFKYSAKQRGGYKIEILKQNNIKRNCNKSVLKAIIRKISTKCTTIFEMTLYIVWKL
jgi:hypothetical protein